MSQITTLPPPLDRPSLPHSTAQIIHACKRASERYGFEFTRDDYTKLLKRLLSQKEGNGVVFLRHDVIHEGRVHYAVWHGAEWLPIVFDRRNKTIVTFLPKYILRKFQHVLPW